MVTSALYFVLFCRHLWRPHFRLEEDVVVPWRRPLIWWRRLGGYFGRLLNCQKGEKQASIVLPGCVAAAIRHLLHQVVEVVVGDRQTESHERRPAGGCPAPHLREAATLVCGASGAAGGRRATEWAGERGQ